jgi:hypothetical protein
MENGDKSTAELFEPFAIGGLKVKNRDNRFGCDVGKLKTWPVPSLTLLEDCDIGGKQYVWHTSGCPTQQGRTL